MKQRTKHLTVRDGNLIPLGNNFAYVLGDHPNKVDDVDIGPNNRNGLSVNHGEIMQFGRTGVRVFSAEPILNGVSPSKLVQAGINPNVVFAAQERYKDINRLKDNGDSYKSGGIHIAPSKRGTFTAAAKQHGMGVQAFASKVLANKSNYSPAMVKKANFAHNASKWHHALGGEITEKEYITNKIDSIRTAALNKSRVRKLPKVPYGLKEDQLNRINSAKATADFIRGNVQDIMESSRFDSDTKNHLRLQELRQAALYDKEAEDYKTRKLLAPGLSCIGTATDNYGNEHLVYSNKLFAKNPEKYGFIRIPLKNIEGGDIVQHNSHDGTPFHAIMYDGTKNENNIMLFNYSDGGDDESAIKKQAVYRNYLTKEFNPEDLFTAYRFVGTPADSLKWRAEYQQKYGKRLGGETKVKNDYLTIPLKGNPLYDISGETKYSDYVTKHGPDFSTIKTTNNRPYNQYNVETAYNYFKSKELNDYQIAAFLANAIEESGVEPYALDKTGVYYGISQWDNNRYSVIRKSKKDKDYSIEDESKYLNNQLAYYYNSVMNGNTTSDWNHGGKGSGYNTAADARQSFRNATSVDDAIKALVLGYVRPTGGINSYKNRAKVAEQIYKLISKQ